MPKLILSLIAVVSLAFSPLGWSWNTYGHLLFTDLAFSKLEPATQRHFDQLAYSLVRQMDSQKRLYLMRTFEDTSALAQLSVFPDDWSDITVAELYQRYAQEMPAAMEKYADTTTNGWHHIEQAYLPEAGGLACVTEKADTNIASVLPDLITAYKESSDEGARALSLAFILNLVADAHNPIHTMIKVDADCQSDLGGRRFCVAYHRGSRACEQNLLQAWDGALGFFDEHEKIADAKEFLSMVNLEKADAAILDPQAWVAEGYEMARLVYAATEGKELDPYYVDEGKIISHEQIALGAARLATILNEL